MTALELPVQMAFHETGHAVVAASMGWDVTLVWTGSAGGCAYTCSEMSNVERRLAVCVAGVCAEAVARGYGEFYEFLDDVDRALADGKKSTNGDAFDIAEIFRNEDHDLVHSRVRLAIAEATDILESDWDDVEVIAGCLMPAQVLA
jgi:hypothetical protein